MTFVITDDHDWQEQVFDTLFYYRGLRLIRRDHLRALAQRIEVADTEVHIMGSKPELLRALVAASGGKTGVAGVRRSVTKWRTVGNETSNNYVIDIVVANRSPSRFQRRSGRG